MKLVLNLLSGLAGAIVLNAIHESARKLFHDAPHVHEVGEEGLQQSLKSLGIKPPRGKALYATTLAADVASNAFYYSMIGKGPKKDLWLRGLAYGLTGGLGALGLTKAAGLNDKPVNRTALTSFLTVAWYTAGGLATAAVAKLLQEKCK